MAGCHFCVMIWKCLFVNRESGSEGDENQRIVIPAWKPQYSGIVLSRLWWPGCQAAEINLCHESIMVSFGNSEASGDAVPSALFRSRDCFTEYLEQNVLLAREPLASTASGIVCGITQKLYDTLHDLKNTVADNCELENGLALGCSDGSLNLGTAHRRFEEEVQGILEALGRFQSAIQNLTLIHWPRRQWLLFEALLTNGLDRFLHGRSLDMGGFRLEFVTFRKLYQYYAVPKAQASNPRHKPTSGKSTADNQDQFEATAAQQKPLVAKYEPPPNSTPSEFFQDGDWAKFCASLEPLQQDRQNAVQTDFAKLRISADRLEQRIQSLPQILPSCTTRYHEWLLDMIVSSLKDLKTGMSMHIEHCMKPGVAISRIGRFLGPAENPISRGGARACKSTGQDSHSSEDDSTISYDNLETAKSWLQACLGFHEPCHSVEHTKPTSRLPTRVIDVSNAEAPSIVLGWGREVPYFTLSYKWGTSKQFQTTRHDEYSLPVEKLSRTIRDAIWITNILGCQYLWVDALCIVQNDAADKAREINIMHEIYRNSTLTLFAAAADGVEHGIGAVRDRRLTRPCSLDIKLDIEDNKTTGFSVQIILDKEDRQLLGLEPLYRRGWVLQEEILSRRALVFGSRMIYWECLCESLDEYSSYPSYRLEPITLPNGPETMGFVGLRSKLILRRQQRTGPQPAGTYFEWYEMVSDFCYRNLSHTEDILPALDGIKNAFMEVTGGTFLEGIWKEEIYLGLAWYVASNGHGDRTSFWGLLERVTDRTGPDWSWTSHFNAPIKFWDYWKTNARVVSDLSLQAAPEPCLATAQIPSRSFGSFLSFFGLPITTKASAFLKVVGYGKPAIVKALRSRVASWSEFDKTAPWAVKQPQLSWPVYDPTTRLQIGVMAMDSAFDAPLFLEEKITCLICTVWKKYKEEHIICLALKLVDKEQQLYRRIGLVSLLPSRVRWINGETKDIEGADSLEYEWDPILRHRPVSHDSQPAELCALGIVSTAPRPVLFALITLFDSRLAKVAFSVACLFLFHYRFGRIGLNLVPLWSQEL